MRLWEPLGARYPIGMEPARDRRLDSLHPLFRHPLEAWLDACVRRLPHVDVRVTETRRTEERQAWLFAQGREEPYLGATRVTWTMDSRHRWGLAADLAMIRRSSGEAIWEIPSWRHLYQVVPLEPFGLKHIAPAEWVHVELQWADEAIVHAELLGLTQT